MRRTPLLFNRNKTEKQLFAVFIRAYYAPIIEQHDVIFNEEAKKDRESQLEKKSKEEKEEAPETELEKIQMWASH